MAVTYTTLLGLAKPQSGTEDGQWGNIVNDQITDLLDTAVAGASTIDVTAGNVTLTDNDGASDEARSAILLVTGTPGTSRNIIAPSRSKVYIVVNGSDGAVVIKGSATTGATLAAGAKGVIAWNGSDFVQVGREGTVTSVGGTGTVNGITLTGTVTSSGNLTLGGTLANVNLASQVTGTLPVGNGGTGQTSYTNGQLLIGNTTGNTLTKSTLTAGSGITITNGAGSITIASTGGGSGDVTGPASSTDNAITRFDSTTGKVIQNSSVTLSDTFGGGSNDRAARMVFPNNNLAIGTDALNTATTQSFSNNIAFGRNTLNSTWGDYEGSYNIAIGYDAGRAIDTTSTFAIMIGGYAGGNTYKVGDNSIIIGQSAEPGGDNREEIVIGVAISGKGNNTAFIGGSAGAYNGNNSSSWQTTSDQRIKKNIVNSPKGLAEINQVLVRNFQYKSDEEMPVTETGAPLVKGLDSQTLQTGFIAQELQTVFPEAVQESGNGVLSVNVDPVVYALINAVKELSAEVAALKAQINGG